MAAVDQERARREHAAQEASVDELRQRLESLRGSGGGASLSDVDLNQELEATGRANQELTIRLERQRASLERGASHIPEVAPLEERLAELKLQVERLEEFGAACAMAAVTLETASAELRRSYAPRLQAYLGQAIERVTAGRYREALVTDAFDVMLRAPESGSMVDLRRLSRGTQQQVYSTPPPGAAGDHGGRCRAPANAPGRCPRPRRRPPPRRAATRPRRGSRGR